MPNRTSRPAAGHAAGRAGQRPRRVAILVMPAFSNLTLAAVMEPLRAANRMAGAALYDWVVASDRGQAVASSSGLRIAPDCALDALEGFDMLHVVAAFEAEQSASPRVRGLLRNAGRGRVLLGGLESGAYILAAAGLLDGFKATTHWEDLQDFAERFPSVDLRPDRFVIDRTRVTSGGALPTLDLMLELIRRDHGLGLALAVSSAFIYERPQSGEDPQHMLAAGRLALQDPVLLRALRAMEGNVGEPLAIASIAARAGVGTRELLRRFRQRLATSPKAYYTGLRLTLARRLLEHGEQSVSEVALACGFASPSAFARAFREKFASSPSDFRRR